MRRGRTPQLIGAPKGGCNVAHDLYGAAKTVIGSLWNGPKAPPMTALPRESRDGDPSVNMTRTPSTTAWVPLFHLPYAMSFDSPSAPTPISSPSAENTDRIAGMRQICEAIPPTVRVMAVTKTVPPDRVRLAYAAGIRDFGENRIQEAIPKQVALADLEDVTWHFIGRLQSNKARKAVEHFDWIHSVDSLKLAERLHNVGDSLDRSVTLSLQVKLRPDPNKGGWLKSELWEALPSLKAYSRLQIKGLMIIPPANLATAEILKVFEEGAAFFRDLQHYARDQSSTIFNLQHLSMGMSGDYQYAIENGSTMVRLGSCLFGDRPPVASPL